jgi:cytochrome c peroxidase
MRRAALLLLAALAAAACDERSLTIGDPDTTFTIDQQLRQAIGNWGVVAIGAVPVQSPAVVALGQALFFDPVLSGNRDVACATCHHPATHFTDGLSLPLGTGATGSGTAREPGAGRAHLPRSAPTLLNSALGFYQMFWDGRLTGFGQGTFFVQPDTALPGVPTIVAAQALLPVLSRGEMRGLAGDTDRFGAANELAAIADADRYGVWNALMARLRAIPAYQQQFAAAFPALGPSGHDFTHAAMAIAAFQTAALTTTNSPFDRYLARDDAALTLQQKRGALLFFGRAQCSSCHSGPLLGGNGIANTGVPQLGPGVGAAAPLDHGRGGIDTFTTFYRFAFRVPPLRNVELTAPYFHDGAYPTLAAVVRHYNDVAASLRGYDPAVQLAQAAARTMHHGDQATVAQIMETLDFRIRTPLNLSQAEIADLVAFLEALTDPAARDLSALRPAAVPSGLPVP